MKTIIITFENEEIFNAFNEELINEIREGIEEDSTFGTIEETDTDIKIHFKRLND